MNKKTIITILLALAALSGQAQVNYCIDGNTGHPDFTGTLYLYDYSSFLDSVQVVKGVITEHSGQLPQSRLCTLASRDWKNKRQATVHRGRLYTRRRSFCREMVLRVGHAYER